MITVSLLVHNHELGTSDLQSRKKLKIEFCSPHLDSRPSENPLDWKSQKTTET